MPEDTIGLDKPNTDNEGENLTNQPAIDWTKVKVTDIPENVLKAHPLVTALDKRVKDREQTIKKMRDASTEGEGEKPKPEQTQTDTNNPTDVLMRQFEKLNSQMDAILKRDAESQQQNLVNATLKKHRLPDDPDVRELLGKVPVTDVDAEGLRLAKLMKIPATETGGGNSGNTGNGALDPLRQRILDRVKSGGKPFNDENNPMSPGYQRMGN